MGVVEKSYTATETYSDYDTTVRESEFGGETDTFGMDLTVEKLQDPSFRIDFDIDPDTDGTIMVESVEVDVFYTLPEGSYDPDEISPPFIPTPHAAVAIGLGPAGKQRIVIVGAKGEIRVSDDKGETWQEKDSKVASTLRAVHYSDDDGFIAVGEGGAVTVSTDGDTWSSVATGANRDFFGVTDAGSGYVVAGSKGAIRRRRSGVWEIYG